MSDTSEWASAPLEGVVHEDATPSMDPKVRDLFVAALRSGAYEQGYNRLRSGDEKFTALGVLCDLATKVRNAPCTWDRMDGLWFISPVTPESATGAFLPPAVREWAKIRGTHPSQELPLVWRGAKHPIWRVTDIFMVPFSEVADLIQSQY